MSSAGVAICPFRQDSVVSPKFLQHQSCLPPDESILVYVACSGSMMPMRVLESDSIESVKLRIQSFKGFVVKKQKLVCGGRELSRNNSLVRDYGVADGNLLHLVLRLSDLQVINVRTVAGKEFTFHVERSRDVGYVKRQVAMNARDIANDPDDQEVLCNGERLDDQQLIDDISNQNGAVIHLLVRKSSKVRATPVEKNFELSIVASSELSNGGRRNDVGQQNAGQFDVEEEEEQEEEEEEVNCTELDGERENFHGMYPERAIQLEPIIVNPKVELSSAMWDLMDSTLEGLECGYQPVRSAEGTGGVYFMQDAYGNCVSVFKPIDEEPMAVHNPHGLPLSTDGEGLKKGTVVGEGAFREVAAYLLDHPKGGRRSLFGDEKGFAGVAPTVLIKCLHPGFNHAKKGVVDVKIGSLQMFMENQGSCEDLGPGAFPVDEVHRISVLDIRLANADRHAGNILLSKGGKMLIPIDHGYCLPESFEDCTFDWLYWPQARQPYSRETIEYIKSMDADEDIALLKYHGWDLPARVARVLQISTMLLKKGAVERGFTPFMIGNIMCRQTLNKKSMIEEIVEEAQDSVLPYTSEAAFLEAVSQIMDCRLDQI